MKILVRWILLSKDDWQMEDVRFLLQSDDMDVDKDQSLSFWSRWRERFCSWFLSSFFSNLTSKFVGFHQSFFFQIWSLKCYYQFIICLFSAFKQHRERFGANSPRFLFSTSYSFGMDKTICLKLWSPNCLVTSRVSLLLSLFHVMRILLTHPNCRHYEKTGAKAAIYHVPSEAHPKTYLVMNMNLKDGQIIVWYPLRMSLSLTKKKNSRDLSRYQTSHQWIICVNKILRSKDPSTESQMLHFLVSAWGSTLACCKLGGDLVSSPTLGVELHWNNPKTRRGRVGSRFATRERSVAGWFLLGGFGVRCCFLIFLYAVGRYIGLYGSRLFDLRQKEMDD